MQIISDLQLHSRFSRAVSPKMDLFEISRWSSKKGINLVATGDWTHPVWFKEIQTFLEETAPGIYSLKNQPADQKNPVNFLLSTEISSIYSQGGRVRRIHNLIFSPSVDTCAMIIKELQRRGCNLMSDGRPIIGLTSKELLELVLEIDEDCLLVPAHIWTPWFSLFGSKSGFDSVDECFDEFSKHIYAIETGLSSDPIMNWQIKDLETRSILSFSDAHSGSKLGREATVFVSTDSRLPATDNLTYNNIADAIKQVTGSKLKIGYTIEFFPEEGKYHCSGHRACNVHYSSEDIKTNGIICPVCHKPLTIGVDKRIADLSAKIFNKDDLVFVKNSVGVTFVGDRERKRRPFVSLIPLLEILEEVEGGSPVKAGREYERLTANFAAEFDILLRKSYEEIEKAGGKKLSDAIRKIRDRKVFVEPGYDGVFGTVKIFNENEKNQVEKKGGQNQPKLF